MEICLNAVSWLPFVNEDSRKLHADKDIKSNYLLLQYGCREKIHPVKKIAFYYCLKNEELTLI